MGCQTGFHEEAVLAFCLAGVIKQGRLSNGSFVFRIKETCSMLSDINTDCFIRGWSQAGPPMDLLRQKGRAMRVFIQTNDESSHFWSWCLETEQGQCSTLFILAAHFSHWLYTQSAVPYNTPVLVLAFVDISVKLLRITNTECNFLGVYLC